METKYVAYYRVSRESQGQSGLGLEAQKADVKRFTNNCPNCVIKEFIEVETGTNKKHRPILAEAIQQAKEKGAVLLIAKLDRLARNVHFVSSLMESHVKFKAVDMPEADNFTIHIFAALAEREAKLVSERTKKALQAKKARGAKLGKPENLTTEAIKKGLQARRDNAKNNDNNRKAIALIKSLRKEGLPWSTIATRLNEAGFKTSRGSKFQAVQVQRLFDQELSHHSWESVSLPFTWDLEELKSSR